jgi:hypothetical protein
MYEGAGLGPKDVDIFNPFDGYAPMTQFFLEAFQWHGLKRGDAFAFEEAHRGALAGGSHERRDRGGNATNRHDVVHASSSLGPGEQPSMSFSSNALAATA